MPSTKNSHGLSRASDGLLISQNAEIQPSRQQFHVASQEIGIYVLMN